MSNPKWMLTREERLEAMKHPLDYPAAEVMHQLTELAQA